MARQKKLKIQLKRAYETPAPSDGFRILVDRIWPRGLSKERAAVDEWVQEVAPSTELRKWFGHEPAKWEGFKKKYFSELDGRPDALEPVLEACSRGTVTLLFSAKDSEHNNAVALQEYLEKHMPTSHRASSARRHERR